MAPRNPLIPISMCLPFAVRSSPTGALLIRLLHEDLQTVQAAPDGALERLLAREQRRFQREQRLVGGIDQHDSAIFNETGICVRWYAIGAEIALIVTKIVEKTVTEYQWRFYCLV